MGALHPAAMVVLAMMVSLTWMGLAPPVSPPGVPRTIPTAGPPAGPASHPNGDDGGGQSSPSLDGKLGRLVSDEEKDEGAFATVLGPFAHSPAAETADAAVSVRLTAVVLLGGVAF